MKRLLLFCLTALFSVTTWAYEFEAGGIYYNALSANTAEVTYASDAYNSYSGVVSIPETVTNGSDEYTVVSIGNYAFNSSTGLTSISISKNVTSIGEYAFTGCTGLTSLTIPGNVTSIGTQAFASCGIKELTLEDGTEDLVTTSSTSANTFTNCEIEKVYLGRTLAPSAKAYPPLRGQESLTTAEISSNLSSIYQYCFYGCSSLKEINIPNSISEIADYTFYGCSSLTNDNLTLPETVTAIGAYGFYGCTGLTSFCFTGGLSSVGNYAFAGCSGVEGTLKVPSSITSMGQYAFRECTGLTTVSFESDDSPISVGMFYGCSAMTELTLPSNIETVSNYLCQNCSAMEDITIPSKVTSIGQYAFKACSSLKSISFDNGSIITTTGNYAFQDCIALEEIEFPSGLTSLGTYNFHGCTGLKRATVNEGLTTLANYTFYGCSSLADVTLPESLTTINTNVFQNCTSLKVITLPEAVTKLNTSTFNGCSAMEQLFSLNSTPPSASSNTFTSVPSTCYIIVPTGASATYAKTNYWKNFANIIEFTPIVEDIEVEDITENSAIFSASYTAGYYETIEKGFEYWASEDDVKTAIVEGDDMKVEVTDLTASTTYTYRAYAKVQEDNTVVYSESGTFTTWDAEEGTPLADGEKFEVDGIYYTVVSSEELTVEVAWGGETQTSSTDSYVGEIDIPETTTYENVTYTVIGIGNSAFRKCAGLTKVTIPETVTYYGVYAFRECTSLDNFVISDYVTSIGNYSFYQCSSLSELKIPDSVTSLGTHLCYECTSLTSLTLGKNIDTVGSNAFYGCSALTEVEIPGNASPIGISAFRYCTNLEKVTIESGASQINNYAFADCPALKSFEVPESPTKLGDYVFLNDTGLEEVTIGVNIESIGKQVFKDCSSLASVTALPTNPPSCGSDAFSGIASNAILYVQDGYVDTYKAADTWQDFYDVRVIGDEGGTPLADGEQFNVDGFYYTVVSGDSRTVEITWGGEKNTSGTDTYTGDLSIPSEVTYENVTYTVIGLGDSAFRQCEGLTSVVIPNTVTYIGGTYVFSKCSSLTSVTIPESVTYIGDEAFYNCTALEEITLPNSVETLSTYAFWTCSKLKKVTLPEALTEIGQYTFYKCSVLAECTLPQTITSIGKDAFYQCEALEKVEIPDALTSIGDYAYYKCLALKEVELKAGITTWGQYTFQGCTALTDVTFPEGLATLGNYAFSSCSALESVKFNSDLTSLGDNGFSNSGLKEVDIPASVEKINSKAFYNCDLLTTVTMHDGTTIIGDNAFYDCAILETIKFPESTLTTIGEKAFYQDPAITAITIPASVVEIESDAFDRCTGLATISFEENSNLTTLGKNTFYKCEKLTDVVLPNSITFMDSGTFYYCSALETVTLPENIEELTISTFRYCTSLKEVAVPEKVTVINNYAFDGCTALTKVTLSNNITDLGQYTFQNCSSLVDVIAIADGEALNTSGVHIPDGVETMKISEFINCASIEEVSIPEKVMEFKNKVFQNCEKLASVTCYNPEPATCGTDVFDGIDENCVLYVPCGSEDAYSEADTWSDFSTIVGLDCEPITFDYTLDPPEGEVSSLHSISLTYEDGVQLNAKESQWGNAKVYDANGDEVVEVIIATPIGTYGQTYTGYSFTIGLDGSSQDVTDAGDYYFVIPEGYLSFYDSTNDTWVECEQIIAHYVIEGEGDTGGTEAPYTVEPAEGTVESLSYVKFIDEGAICYTEEVDPSEVKVYKDGDMTSAVAYGVSVDDDYTSGAWDDAVKVTFNTTLTVEGEYTVVVPAGLFNIGSWTVVNDEIILNYTVDGSANTGTFVCDVDPADGAKMTKLDQLVFTNPSGGEIFVNEEIRDLEINVYDEGDELVTKVTNFYTDFGDNWEEWAQIAMFGGSDDEGNVYPSEITAEGTYYVSVPANVFFIYDEGGSLCYNESMSLTYIISADAGTENPDYTLSFNPEDGSTLDVLSAISIYCEDGITQVLMPDEDITITDAENNSWSGSYSITEVANDLGIVTEVVITLSPEIVEAGTYYVNVPSGYFDINQRMNEAFTLTYTITGTYTGISGISINDENVEGIYSVGGQKLNTTVKGVNIIRFSDGSVKKIYIK